MGFGRGKGFTSKVREEAITVSVKSGGGAARITLTDANPTVSARGGGGASKITLTDANPTVSTGVS